MKRIKLAFGLFWFAITKGHTLQLGLLNCVSQIFDFFIKANTSDRPMYTKLIISTDENTHLNLWCSKGVTPSERAIELAKENQKLLSEIEAYKNRIRVLEKFIPKSDNNVVED